MMAAKDTSKTGLLLNQKVIEVINDVTYKQDLWMVSDEKIFIRGIFQNLIESTSGVRLPENDTLNDSQGDVLNDSAAEKEKLTIENLYKRFNSISFSADMSENLKFLVQCECINEESSKYLKSILNGLITAAKLSNAGKQKSSAPKLFDNLKLDRYDNSVFIEMNVDESNLRELRKTKLMNEPGE